MAHKLGPGLTLFDVMHTKIHYHCWGHLKSGLQKNAGFLVITIVITQDGLLNGFDCAFKWPDNV